MALMVQAGLDFIAARLHGRRSRFAEAERLDTLCRIRSVGELARTLYPESVFHTPADIQRQIVREMADETQKISGTMDDASDALLDWQRRRFMVENLKVLARAAMTRRPPSEWQEYLLPLPPHVQWDARALGSADSVETFIERMPEPVLKKGLRRIRDLFRPPSSSFFLESGLDAAYFRELMLRAGRLADEDRGIVIRLVQQEVDHFHLMLVARGRFLHGLDVAALARLHVAGAGIRAGRFESMLTAPDLRAAAALAVGRAVDAVPAQADAASLERGAWDRWWRLANAAFRRSVTGLAVAAGYLVLRRIECANVITLTEGIRLGMEPGALRARMIPREHLGAVHA